MMKQALLPLALCLAVLQGCTVKEDRAACPCMLDILLPESATSPEMLLSIRSGRDEVYSAAVKVEPGGSCVTVPVPKGRVSLYALDRRTGVDFIGRYVDIPEGSQCDSLYSFFAPVVCESESAVVTVSTKKQFATVMLKFGPDCFGSGEVSGVRVRGGVSGLDLENSSPISGTFLFECPLDGDLSCSFRVPRQLDDSLELDALSAGGSTVCTFPLGLMISRGGFDWTETALKDILVDIDGSSEFDVRINVVEWDTRTI